MWPDLSRQYKLLKEETQTCYITLPSGFIFRFYQAALPLLVIIHLVFLKGSLGMVNLIF